MGSDEQNIHRRDFLKQSAFWGISAAFSGAVVKASYAASKERLTILSSVSLDTLHPYAHSSSPQYGIWNNMLEPLVEVNYAKRDYFGVLAESWEFQGRKWVFKLRRNVRFHDGSPFTAEDVVYTMQLWADPKHLASSSASGIALDQVTAVDELTEIVRSISRRIAEVGLGDKQAILDQYADILRLRNRLASTAPEDKAWTRDALDVRNRFMFDCAASLFWASGRITTAPFHTARDSPATTPL